MTWKIDRNHAIDWHDWIGMLCFKFDQDCTTWIGKKSLSICDWLWMFDECLLLMLTESVMAMISFKTFHVAQLSYFISCMSILMYGWDILLVVVLFFCLCSSYKVSQSASNWLKTVFNLASQLKVLHINGWPKQSWFVSNIMTSLSSSVQQWTYYLSI